MLDIRSFCSPTHAPVSAFIKLYLYSRHPSRVLIVPSPHSPRNQFFIAIEYERLLADFYFEFFEKASVISRLFLS